MDNTKAKLVIETFARLGWEEIVREFPHIQLENELDIDIQWGGVIHGFTIDIHFTNNDRKSNYSTGIWFISGLYNTDTEELGMEVECYGDWVLSYYNHLDNERAGDHPERDESVPNRDRIVILKLKRPLYNHKKILLAKEV
jgi:hypothetical protein